MSTHKLEKALLMPLDKNLLQIRKSRGLTQDQMATLTGIHVNSIKSYEAGKSQPSAQALKTIALALSVSTDELIFDDYERSPDQSLKLAFEAVATMNAEDRQTILSLIEGMILKHQAKTLFSNKQAS